MSFPAPPTTDTARPSFAACRDCVERIAASRVFGGSPKLVRFLRFVADETIAGRGDVLKEYVIGVGALGRPPQFDPTADSAVRVAARQLRFKLSEYFAGEGHDDAVVMELPKGGYVPVFNFRHIPTVVDIAELPPPIRSGMNEHLEPVITNKQARRLTLVSGAVILAIAAAYATRIYDNGRRAKTPNAIASQSAADSAARAGLPSIVVLPFLNLSGSPAEEFVSDGITEEITASLARSDRLRVVARTSAFHFKGQSPDVRTVGRDLSANVVLEGSLRKSGDQYRVTTQLIDARDGVHLWTGSYDVNRSDLFKVYDEISRAVAGEINARIGGHISVSGRGYATKDAEAHALYLEGRFNWNKRSPEALKRSVLLLKQAIARDSNYAIAHAGLADSYATMAVNNALKPGEGPPLAIAAARRALALDSTLGEPHAAIALMRAFQDWDWQGADTEFLEAMRLSPNYATAHSWYAITLVTRGRFDDALTQLRQAQALDPLSNAIAYNIAEALYYARRWDESEASIKRLLELQADSPPAYTLRGRVLAAQGRMMQAREAFVIAGDTLAIAQLTDTANSFQQLRGQMRKFSMDQKTAMPYWIGVLYSGLGESDSAFAWFNRAYDVRHLNIVSLGTEPTLDNIRTDPRFDLLLKKMHLDAATLASATRTSK